MRFLFTFENLRRPLVFLRNNVRSFLVVNYLPFSRSCLRGGSSESWGDLAVKEETKSSCRERDLFSGFLAFVGVLCLVLLLLLFVVLS